MTKTRALKIASTLVLTLAAFGAAQAAPVSADKYGYEFRTSVPADKYGYEFRTSVPADKYGYEFQIGRAHV